MRDFFKELGQRLGLGNPAPADVPQNGIADSGIADSDGATAPDALEYVMAQDYYRRDGHTADGSPKFQLRRCLAVHIRGDMWQIREIHTTLTTAPGPDTPATGEEISNTITDMVGSLDEALALLQAFENTLDAEDWLPSAAPPEYPTRAAVSAAQEAAVAEAAE